MDADGAVELATSAETSGASPLESLPRWALFALVLGSLSVAAIVAGLTLGLMSLDMIGLEIMTQSTSASEAQNARRIMPVRAQGNLLLVSLLLTNTIAMEFLPLVLDALYPGGIFALVVSVVLVMLFSEIIPQAVCSRHALAIGAFFIPFVRALEFVLYPIAKPIAWMLDSLLGEELGHVYTRSELKQLINVHSRNRHGVLTEDETTILRGTLDFAEKTVEKIITRSGQVFMLDLDSTILNLDTFRLILRKGHSRIPIFQGSRNNVVALLLTKQLLLVDPTDEIPLRAIISKKKKVHKVRVAPPMYCSRNTKLEELLNEFQLGRSHMAIVVDDVQKPAGERVFLGIATLEDIIEEILQEEIIDETDTVMDNRTMAPVVIREGNQVQRALSLSAAKRMPGTSTILMREIDVQTLRAPIRHAFTKAGLRRRLSSNIARPENRISLDDDDDYALGEYSNDDDSVLDPRSFVHHTDSGVSIASAPPDFDAGEDDELNSVVTSPRGSNQQEKKATEDTPLLSKQQ